MGFFSRLFRTQEPEARATSGWTSLPSEEASTLVLPNAEADELLAQLDIEAAIVGHERWIPWLGSLLQGQRDERLRADVVGNELSSELGQWLHGSGRATLGHLPAFEMMMRRHRYFHQQAAALITHADAGQMLLAAQCFKSCQHASRQVVLLLRELQRGLVRAAAKKNRREIPVSAF